MNQIVILYQNDGNLVIISLDKVIWKNGVGRQHVAQLFELLRINKLGRLEFLRIDLAIIERIIGGRKVITHIGDGGDFDNMGQPLNTLADLLKRF